ncbi:MAG: LPS assembly lipoprotein LptE [Candidatus Tectomicrobia bacterium]|nr:LPS assembly lipoprotein LptE [Candidatus Tectomicrobia bacterium]
MREIHFDFAAARTSLILVAAMTAILLVAACATPPLVVQADPNFSLDHIRSVYVMSFASPDDNRDAERIMTHALREQLQADGIVRVVDQPGLADAYVQGTIETWVRGGLELSGTRPTKIRGSLALLDPAKRTLWLVVAEQWDPLRLMADGLFARDPSALAPHWVRTVLQHLPGYTVKRRPVTPDLVERFLAGDSIADLSRVYTIPPQEVEMFLRQALAARRNEHQR